MEHREGASRKERKRTYEKVLSAHRGLGHARESARHRTGDLGRTSGPSQSVMGLLGSHAIPGVMLCGLSIVHERDNEQAKEKKEIVHV